MTCWLKFLHKSFVANWFQQGALRKAVGSIFLFSLSLFTSYRGYSQKMSRDTIFFRNGSVMIGKIKSVKLGVVTFDPDDANDIRVQLRKLRSMSAVSAVFRIETTDNNVYFDKVVPHADTGYVTLADNPAVV